MPRGANKPMPEYNWAALKVEFLKGPWTNVASFLRDKNMPESFVSYEAKGWGLEKGDILRKAVEKATDDIVESEVNDIRKVRERQARQARWAQLKGLKGMENLEIKTADEARKIWQSGIIQEREALGINEGLKGGNIPSLTQVNVNLPKTKFDQLIDGLDTEGILQLIAEIRRQRTLRAGTATAIEGEAKNTG